MRSPKAMNHNNVWFISLFAVNPIVSAVLLFFKTHNKNYILATSIYQILPTIITPVMICYSR